ncbi:MAG: tetratricopeptide repeat protein [Candidatus Omnitrophota bacterium]
MKYMREGDFERAFLALQEAHNLDPNNNVVKNNLSAAAHNLAVNKAQEGMIPDAIKYEKIAAEKNPTNPMFSEQLAVLYNNYAMSLAKNDRYDLALPNFKEGLKIAPDSPELKQNLYYTTMNEAAKCLRANRKQESINFAKDCIAFDPNNAEAYMFLGDFYYAANDLNEAIQYWDKALTLQPQSVELKQMMEKAKRELQAEKGFKNRARPNFDVRFEGRQDTGVIWDIVDLLEDARRYVKGEFMFYTDQKITAIVYDSDRFKTATNERDWTFGLYDGKVRLRLADAVSDNKEMLKEILYHEYGHAILNILYPRNIPNWLHEGFAQYVQPQNDLTAPDRSLVANFFKTKGTFTLEKVNALFKAKTHVEITQAYVLAKLFLDYFIDRYGKYKFKKLLERLNSGMPFEKAVYEITRLHVDQIENEFVASLK